MSNQSEQPSFESQAFEISVVVADDLIGLIAHTLCKQNFREMALSGRPLPAASLAVGVVFKSVISLHTGSARNTFRSFQVIRDALPEAVAA